MGFQFSAEELAVLRECDIESLVQRSIPLGIVMGVGTWAACQRGFLKPTGATAKVVSACIAGYFLGKLSYQSKCAEKVMRLPNSQLAEVLRRKRKGEFFEKFTPDGGLSLAPFSSAAEFYTDDHLKSHQQNSLDMDLDRPANSGLDDTFRPSLDNPDRNFNDNLPLDPPKSSTSYEELRRRNREDYNNRMQQPFRQPAPRDEAPIINRAQPEREPGSVKNQYGDVWK